MKPKLDKKAKKRDLPISEDVITNGNAPSPKPAKKAKLAENGAQQKQKSEPDQQTSAPAKSATPMIGSVFQHFKDLTHEEEEKRMKAALQLVQQMSKTKEPEKRQKELAYTLKRLIRGCGAATNASRAGFYTGLVAFLKAFDAVELPMEQVFEAMQKELHVGTSIGNKEDADAVVGKVLVCGALLQAGRLLNVDNEHLERITNTLLQAAKQRTYHASLSYAFLIELADKLSLVQFSAAVWPLLQIELQRSWSKQTLQTVQCLIAVQRRFPTLVSNKFMKAHFGNNELFNAESYTHLYKIFWDNSNWQLLTHPAFELCGAYLATSANLAEFWTQHVDVGLQTHSKLRQLQTLKIATDVLNNWKKTTKQTAVVTDLLSENFMHTLVEGLKNLKQKKDETVIAFYDEFFDALIGYCALQQTEDAERVAVIRRLVLPPGLFSIEKYTSSRVVHQLINVLGVSGVKDIFELYKSIFLGKLAKNPENNSETWLNFELLNAGYMLQHLLAHKTVRGAYEWRGEQLCFLLTCGIFNVDTNVDMCKKEAANTFSKEFGEQCKNMFFTSLQSRLVEMEQEQQLLLQLVHLCNERMEQKHVAKYFRIKQYDETMHNYWRQMYQAVCGMESVDDKRKKKANDKSGTANKDKLQLVFHILLLNMGLHLFREPEMAGPAIEDLLKCMDQVKLKEKPKPKEKHNKSNKSVDAEDEEEPEWIEVVVDLFLHLLSQNASALRNIVNALFPHLCDNLNLSAVHQILAMLDMKDGLNPLSAKGDDDDDDDSTDDEAEDNNDDDAQNKTVKVNGKAASDTESETESDDSDNDDDDDDDEEDDDDADEDEDDEEGVDEVTETDKLRNAISQALIENGGAALCADDDMESIDLNDMSDEQGRKLDEALAAAFKALKKSGGSGGASSKKSKSHRVKVTTVMHFRIRVIDLIEIYLQQKPTLLISIEVMLALFDMLQYCVGDELKPLQTRVEKLLQKLTALKNFTHDADVTEENLVDFIRLIVEKKSPAAAFEAMNKLRSKCVIFLINSVNRIAQTSSNADSSLQTGNKVLALCQEYMLEFMQSRNPTVNITLLADLFRLRWRGVWELAMSLAQQGIIMQTRIFRRIQIYELLDVLYKNNELQKLDVSSTKTKLEKIEKALSAHIKQLASATAAGNVKQTSPKEYASLLQLLLLVQRTNARLQLKSVLANPEVCEAMQSMRKDTTQLYQRYCAAYKMTAVRDNKKQETVIAAKQNEKSKPTKALQEDAVAEATATATETVSKKKRKKNKDTSQRQQKKQKKQARLQAASKGINGGFGFAQTTASASDEEGDAEVV